VISTYAKDIKVTIASDNFVKHGCKWIGENGWVISNRGKIEASNPSGSSRSSIRARSSCTTAAHQQELHRLREVAQADHLPDRDVAPLDHAGHLGYVSAALKRKLKWDPKKEVVIGDDEAMKLLNKCEYRAPWKFPG
jgi:hypothetical protein